jgi:hypothetical protein
MTGSATNGQPVSWYNGLNHQASGVGSTKPAVYYKEDMDGDGEFDGTVHQYYSTISYGQAWSVIEYTIPVQSYSADYIKVLHRYYDPQGNQLWAYTSFKNHYYTH